MSPAGTRTLGDGGAGGGLENARAEVAGEGGARRVDQEDLVVLLVVVVVVGTQPCAGRMWDRSDQFRADDGRAAHGTTQSSERTHARTRRFGCFCFR